MIVLDKPWKVKTFAVVAYWGWAIVVCAGLMVYHAWA